MARDIAQLRHTSNASIALYYAGTTGRTATAALNSGTIMAVNFTAGSGGVLGRAAVYLTNVEAGGYVRGAIYGPRSTTDLYPGPLLLDVGCFEAGTTGLKTNSIYLASSGDTLYWLCAWANGLTGGIIGTSIGARGSWPVWGDTGTGLTAVEGNCTVPFTGTLWPSTFPVSGASVAQGRLNLMVVYSG